VNTSHESWLQLRRIREMVIVLKFGKFFVVLGLQLHFQFDGRHRMSGPAVGATERRMGR